MTTQWTAKEMAPYIERLQKRKAAEKQARMERCAKARETAGRIATLLKEKYGVKKIYLFGSTLNPDYFFERSDIDIAVSSCGDDVFFKMWSDADRVADNFEVDLVPLDACKEYIRKSVLERGVEL